VQILLPDLDTLPDAPVLFVRVKERKNNAPVVCFPDRRTKRAEQAESESSGEAQ